MFSDLRYAFRQLAKNPGFALGVVLILALAIGANTAEFSLTEAALLRPLPWPHAERVVWVWNQHPEVGISAGAVSIPVYLERREQVDAFADSMLTMGISLNLAGGSSPEQIQGQRVTPSFFTTIGVSPARGRAFTADEATPGHDKVAILSDELWQSYFGADEATLGRDLRLNGENYRVVGIMPKGFFFMDPRNRILVPFAFAAPQMAENQWAVESSLMVARLRPDATIEQAQREIDAIKQRDGERGIGGVVAGFQEFNVRNFRPGLLTLQAAVAFTLLIACANLANLLLVRATARRRELAIRLALGAGRLRLARQLLVENFVLVLIGSALGILVGYWGLGGLRWLGGDLVRFLTLSIDRGVLAFTLLLALGSGLFFGLVPLVSLWRHDPAEVLGDGNGRGSAGRSAGAARSTLIVAEVGLAVMLLIAAGLTVKSLANLQTVRPGFASDNVLTAQITLPGAIYRDAAAQGSFYAKALERIRQLPGVKFASAVSTLPFSGASNTSSYAIKGYTPPKGESDPHGKIEEIDPTYFEAMQIPLARGRGFSDRDGPKGMPVVIVDQFFVHRYFAGRDPIGAQLKFFGKAEDWCTIIGVVGDVKSGSLSEPVAKETIYFPLAQRPRAQTMLVLKTAADPRSFVSPLREAIQAIDPELPPYDVRTMDGRLADSLLPNRFLMFLMAVFGVGALALASLGLYTVLAYSISQRTREFGIRIALGAQGRAILALVIGRGLRLTLLGVALGLVASFGLDRFLASLLYGVGANDPLIYVVIPVLLIAVAMLACYLPARQATKVDPAVTLRVE